jgi:hypothetical protein
METDFEWVPAPLIDGQIDGIQVIAITKRDPTEYWAGVKALPRVTTNKDDAVVLRVPVHVGAKAKPLGPGIELQVSARFVKKPPSAAGAAVDPKYTDDLAAYRLKLRDWETMVDERRAAGNTEADEWEAGMLASLNPVGEIVVELIRKVNDEERNDAWEIELIQRIFEWERASFTTYPGWWLNRPLRDPTRDPSDFVNASWARLYLPVRVGMERLALRWIQENKTTKLSASLEAQFDVIEDDLKKFRKKQFGDEDEMPEPSGASKNYEEKYETVANWVDYLPSDGVHMEVVQASSMAADEVTLREVDEASKLRQAMIASHEEDARLKHKAYDKITQPAALEVNIAPGGSSNGST